MTKNEALTILRANKPRLAQDYGLTQLGIFGSVARDEANLGSDVDVVVSMSKPDLFQLSALRQDLVELLSSDVDLVHTHSHLRPLFRELLERDAVYV